MSEDYRFLQEAIYPGGVKWEFQQWIYSDQGSHFVNWVIQLIGTALGLELKCH